MPQNSSKSSEKTPYERAQQVWDARIGNARTQAFNWRLIAFSLIVLLGFSIAGNIYLGAKTKVIPYVVELKPTGEAASLGAASKIQGQTQERAIAFFLGRFVMLSREIPADAVMITDNMHKVFQLVTSQGKALLSQQFRENSPAKEFTYKNRALKIESTLAVSADTYQVDWFEAEYDKQGQKIGEYPMRGTFKVAMLDPKSEAQIKENPLGIFIDYFSWTKLGG